MVDCLLWGTFLTDYKSTYVAHIFVLLFLKYKYVLIFGKKLLGYILLDFITNSSGDPDCNSTKQTKWKNRNFI
jgi:hypothetical protein